MRGRQVSTDGLEIRPMMATSSKLTAELADEPRATSGATGARTATGGSSSNNIGQLVALRPAP